MAKDHEEEIIDETEDENEGLLSLKDHIKKIKDEEGITIISKPKEDVTSNSHFQHSMRIVRFPVMHMSMSLIKKTAIMR